MKLLEGKGYGLCKLTDFLGKAVEPPTPQAIETAIQVLEGIGAIEPSSEKLTLLGRHLAALPLPPRMGKMLLYGILFDCLPPILTVACFMAYRSLACAHLCGWSRPCRRCATARLKHCAA